MSTHFVFAPSCGPGMCFPLNLASWPWSWASLGPEFSFPSSHALQTVPLALLSLQFWVKCHHLHLIPGKLGFGPSLCWALSISKP